MTASLEAGFQTPDGYCQMGSTRTASGLAWIYVLRGDRCAPAPGTLESWIATPTPWVRVLMGTDYEPSFVSRFPVRAAVRGGEACTFPDVEAEALVAAGIAAYP